MIDFLYPPNRLKENDIISDFFVSNFQNWRALRGEKSPLLDKVSEKANKQAAHLTFRRLHIEKGWQTSAILKEISAVWTKFLDNLDEEKRQWFGGN